MESLRKIGESENERRNLKFVAAMICSSPCVFFFTSSLPCRSLRRHRRFVALSFMYFSILYIHTHVCACVCSRHWFSHSVMHVIFFSQSFNSILLYTYSSSFNVDRNAFFFLLHHTYVHVTCSMCCSCCCCCECIFSLHSIPGLGSIKA